MIFTTSSATVEVLYNSKRKQIHSHQQIILDPMDIMGFIENRISQF
jgi:hypothetical protein